MCNCNQVNLLIILILGILLGLIIAAPIGIVLFLGLRTAKAPASRGRDITARRSDRHRPTSSSSSSSPDLSDDDMVHEKGELLQERPIAASTLAPASPSSASEKKKSNKPTTGSRRHINEHGHGQYPPTPSSHLPTRRDPGRDSDRNRRDADKKHRSELHGACSIL